MKQFLLLPLLFSLSTLLLSPHSSLLSQPQAEYYFYQPVDYGSTAMFTPWNVIINGSYDVLQIDGKERRLHKLPYGSGFANVWENVVLHPGASISQIGWDRFIATEILPLTWNSEGAQWIPNYQLHLIGGGMTYRMLAEWYDHKNVAAPEAWAIGTIAAYHVLNEVVEAQDYRGYNTDPIADLLFFDWLGVVLFSFDGVADFFGNTLNMRDWSHLPMITFPEFRLGNNGLYYSLKWNIPNNDQWSVFYLMGMSNMIGASYKFDTENSISLGGGARGIDLYVVDDRARVLSTTLVPTGGVFWDKNGSLMASLTASGQTNQTVILNVYPGVFNIAGIEPAVWSTWGSNGTFGVGVALRGTIGVGYRNQ